MVNTGFPNPFLIPLSSLSIEDLSQPTSHSSILKISQTIDTEEDEDKNCKNYPYLNFSSFGDCDDSYVQQKIKKYDIVPFWATTDFDKVTKLYNGSHYYNPFKPWAFLIDGSVESNCSIPCLSTKVIFFFKFMPNFNSGRGSTV